MDLFFPQALRALRSGQGLTQLSGLPHSAWNSIEHLMSSQHISVELSSLLMALIHSPLSLMKGTHDDKCQFPGSQLSGILVSKVGMVF